MLQVQYLICAGFQGIYMCILLLVTQRYVVWQRLYESRWRGTNIKLLDDGCSGAVLGQCCLQGKHMSIVLVTHRYKTDALWLCDGYLGFRIYRVPHWLFPVTFLRKLLEWNQQKVAGWTDNRKVGG